MHHFSVDSLGKRGYIGVMKREPSDLPVDIYVGSRAMPTSFYFGDMLDEEEQKARREQIEAIFARGNVARFLIRGEEGQVEYWKDIQSWDEDGNDLKSFRQSNNAISPYICWTARKYEIEEVPL